MNQPQQKIAVGISSCLLGQAVRYDGGHKYNSFIAKSLGEHFQLIGFCPEVESGMGVPRQPIQLRLTDQGVRCVAVHDQTHDVTDALKNCSAKQHQWLSELCGYIVKKDSPSCGMEKVKVYKNNLPERIGTGVFAQYLSEHFPLLPVEDEDRLADPLHCENFIQRVYVMLRWKMLLAKPLTPHQLMLFHSRHQLIAMSHDQNQARDLGSLVASAEKNNVEQVAAEYGFALMQCLKVIATRDNHVNVLQHILGLLKHKLENTDKVELIETIDCYRQGKLSLNVPVTLLNHHFRRYPDPFIDQSYYLPANLQTHHNGEI